MFILHLYRFSVGRNTTRLPLKRELRHALRSRIRFSPSHKNSVFDSAVISGISSFWLWHAQCGTRNTVVLRASPELYTSESETTVDSPGGCRIYTLGNRRRTPTGYNFRPLQRIESRHLILPLTATPTRTCRRLVRLADSQTRRTRPSPVWPRRSATGGGNPVRNGWHRARQESRCSSAPGRRVVRDPLERSRVFSSSPTVHLCVLVPGPRPGEPASRRGEWGNPDQTRTPMNVDIQNMVHIKC